MHRLSNFAFIFLASLQCVFAAEPINDPNSKIASPASLSSDDAIHTLKAWINSFRNKDKSYVLETIKDMKITQSSWKFKDHDELLILGSSLEAKTSFYFYKDRVVKASIQFLSE